MIELRSWRDLRPYGIDMLTGESCGLSMRVLCDVTERGRRTICKFLGLPPNVQFEESWNSGSKDDPSIGSILLTHHILSELSVFVCLEAPGIQFCYNAYRGDEWQGVYGFSSEDDEDHQSFLDMNQHYAFHLRRYSYCGTAGDRNRHEMTGRVE